MRLPQVLDKVKLNQTLKENGVRKKTNDLTAFSSALEKTKKKEFTESRNFHHPFHLTQVHRSKAARADASHVLSQTEGEDTCH